MKLQNTLLSKFDSVKNKLNLLRMEANEEKEYSRQVALDYIINEIRSLEKDKKIDAIIKNEMDELNREKP